MPRPRLLELLRQHQDQKFTLVLGQAAQGKSTLAASYVQSLSIPSAWMNLGPEDADPVNLFYLLVHSLQRTLPQLDFSTILTLPSVSLGPREELPLYRDWILSLLKALPGPMQVILDSLDRLAPEAAAFRFLQVLLAEAPRQLHLLMLSRVLPPLEVRELQLRQEAFILKSGELAFTPGETGEYLRTIRHLSLSPKSVKRVQELTEGWIGGVVLLASALEQLPEGQREEYLAAGLDRAFMGGIFQYFGERIFAALPGEVQDFLVKSSILDILEPDFIKDFSGNLQAREILEDRVRRNLFVQTVDDRKRGRRYRYHQLFRDFLLPKFGSALTQEEQQAIYLKAGTLFARNGDFETALNFHLRAGGHEQAALILERIGLDLLRSGRSADLSRWLGDLPTAVIRERPWLLFFRFMTSRFLASREQLALLQQSFDLFQEQGDLRGSILSLAYVIEACFHGHLPEPLPPLLRRGEELQQSLAYDQYLYERAVLWLQMGFSYAMRAGDGRKGFAACENAYLLARDLGEVPLQIHARTNGYLILATLGEFARAAELWGEVEQSIARSPYPDLSTLHSLCTTKYFLILGDLTLAASRLRQTQENIQQHGLMYLYPAHLTDQVMVHFFNGRYREAEDTAITVIQLTSAMGNRYLHGIALQIMTMTLCHKGDYRAAKEYVEKSTAAFSSPEGRSEPNLRWNAIMSGVIACHLDEVGESHEAGIQEALSFFSCSSTYPYMAEAHFTLALVQRARGRMAEALGHLEAGLSIIRERDFLSFNLARGDLAVLYILALEQGLEKVWDYVSRTLATPRFADLAGPELERLSRQANPKVAHKAMQVRRAIHRTRIPPLRFQTLGGFKLWRGEALVDDREWDRTQPRLLLKAIIARGCREVPKSVLVEDLWPEGDPRTGEKTFKVNLHRLRKTLEPSLDPDFGSAYLHLKSNLVSLNQELCRVDAEEFVSCYRQGERLESQGNEKQALSQYRAALDLYRGDFLPEELYHPWAQARREELRGVYLEILHRIAGMHERRGTLIPAIDCYRKVLLAEPLDEQACQRLMLLYAQRGMRSAALKAYQDLQIRLKKELDTEPDMVTTAIYRKILASS